MTTVADLEKMIADMEPAYREQPKVGSDEWLRNIPEPLRQWYKQGMEDVFGAQAVPHKGRAIGPTTRTELYDDRTEQVLKHYSSAQITTKMTFAQRYDLMRYKMQLFPLHCPGLTTGQRLDNALQNLFW